jgi:hypothetical protein
LKSAVTKDDILAQFHTANIRFDDIDKEQLDDEIKNGSAQDLARHLHHRLLVRPLHKTKRYLKKLNNTRTLQAMVLCHVIDQLLRRSDLPVSDYGQQFVEDLSASLPRVLQTLSYGIGYSTIRLVTISSCIRIMRRIATALSQPIGPFIDSLLILFKVTSVTVPSDILIDAACAIASFVALDKTGQMNGKVEEYSGALISILATAASSDFQLEDTLVALSQLARIPALGSVMAKQRGLVIAVNKHLSDNSVDIRTEATTLNIMLISRYGCANETPMLFECNLALIARALTMAALKEVDMKLQLSLIKALSELTQKEDLDIEQADQIKKALFEIASSNDTGDGPAIESALSYLHGASNCVHSVNILYNVVHFTTSQYAKVRVAALELLKDITFWKPDSAVLLLSGTNMLDSFSFIVTHGSDADCCSVTEICEQIVFDNQNHAAFCANAAILPSLVRLLTVEPVTNRVAYTRAVCVVLELMATRLDHFVQFSKFLLPWLVKVANRTSDEDMKACLVSTIIRFSSAILK